jgi:hypothetical protein
MREKLYQLVNFPVATRPGFGSLLLGIRPAQKLE